MVIMPLIWNVHACQAEREAMVKLASAAEEEAGRLKKRLAKANEEQEAAMHKHLAEQQRIQVLWSCQLIIVERAYQPIPLSHMSTVWTTRNRSLGE